MSIQDALILLLLAPLVEEVLFRAGLQDQLLRAGQPPQRASVLSALAFAAAHGFARSWLLGVAVLLPALALAQLYRRTGRLGGCIAAHAALNAGWLALAAVLPPLSVHFPLPVAA